MSSAQSYRVQALSDRSLLKTMYPLLLAQINNLSIPIEQAPMTASIKIGTVHKKLLVDCAKKTDVEKVVRIAVVGVDKKEKSCVYLFFSKAHSDKQWQHRGIQFGSSL